MQDLLARTAAPTDDIFASDDAFGGSGDSAWDAALLGDYKLPALRTAAHPGENHNPLNAMPPTTSVSSPSFQYRATDGAEGMHGLHAMFGKLQRPVMAGLGRGGPTAARGKKLSRRFDSRANKGLRAALARLDLKAKATHDKVTDLDDRDLEHWDDGDAATAAGEAVGGLMGLGIAFEEDSDCDLD